MSTRKFKCKYCGYIGTREQLVIHTEKEHEDLIPEDFTAARIVFNNINHKDHGVCVVCKRETPWNEKTWKYARLCGRPACAKAIRNTYTSNMTNAGRDLDMLNDPEHQAKMLANRSISGEYIFSDGGKRSFTGSYERKFLEFIDKVLEIPSSDILAPGPVFDYEFEGAIHKWITDFLYIPFNLVIEVKDGGSNPNTRQMESYRAKQVAKEKMISNLGTFNYLRLTDNNFEQFLLVLAELKERMIDDSKDNAKVLIKINEDGVGGVGGMPPASSSYDGYVVGYCTIGAFNREDDNVEGFGFVRSMVDDKLLLIDENLNIKSEPISFLENRSYSLYKYNGDVNYNKILRDYENKTTVSENYFYEVLTGNEVLSVDQIVYDSNFTRVEENDLQDIIDISYYSTIHEYKEITNKNIYLELLSPKLIKQKEKLLEGINMIDIKEDVNGFFAINTLYNRRSKSYRSINEISKSILKELGKKGETYYE